MGVPTIPNGVAPGTIYFKGNDPPIGDGGIVFNAVFDTVLTGGLGGGFRLGKSLLTGAASRIAFRLAFSKAERGVISEAQSIISSKQMAQLQAAFNGGKTQVVNVGGRVIQYEPSLPASGMTNFPNGFLMGPEAFTSTLERNQTVLHELYRLTFSKSSGGLSGPLATQETNAAFQFAARAVGFIK